ncbi:MAG: hypothetical protein ACYCTY_16375, partial [Sulfuricella sp.]
RFDEGGQAKWTMVRLLRHRQTKGAATDMLGLRNTEACSLLYPALYSALRLYIRLYISGKKKKPINSICG